MLQIVIFLCTEPFVRLFKFWSTKVILKNKIYFLWCHKDAAYCVKVSHSAMFDSLRPHGLYSPWNSPGQNGVGSLSLLQGLFSSQGSNPGLPHCRQILYQLSHEGNPRILEWVAYSFWVHLPEPGIELGSPALHVDSLPTELSGKPCTLCR